MSQQLREVFADAILKYNKVGHVKGDIDVKTDPRDFFEEAIEELLDTLVYLGKEIARLRYLQELAQKDWGYYLD